MTGAAFIDAGAAWGQDIPLELQTQGNVQTSQTLNEGSLDFKVSEQVQYYFNQSTGD
jgi:hypothetical protein